MERVLYVTGLQKGGGIQTYVNNIQKYMNRDKYVIDFAVGWKDRNLPSESTYISEAVERGSKIYYLPNRRDGLLRSFYIWDKFYREHSEYRIIHIHASSLANAVPLYTAYRNKIPVRIMHSHNIKEGGLKFNQVLHKFHRRNINKWATNYMADSFAAGEWMFGEFVEKNDIRIMSLGIEAADYKYDELQRKRIRSELGIEDNYVIGNVARFHPQKNHLFLLDIFARFAQKYSNSVLLLLGDGAESDRIKKRISELGLDEKVILAGRADDKEWMSVFDIFAFPSLYEGFGIVVIEAQASGLRCVVSEAVPEEAVMTDLVKRIPLEEDMWITELEPFNFYERKKYNEIVRHSKYNVEEAAEMIAKEYDEALVKYVK